MWIVDHADIAGGGQRSALRLARYLGERRDDVRVVCPADSSLAAWCRDAGVTVTDASFPPFRSREVPAIVRAVTQIRSLLGSLPAGTPLVANSARVQAYLYAATRLNRRGATVVHVMHEQDSARRRSAPYVYRRFGSLLVIGEGSARAYRERLPGLAVRAANNFLLREELAAFERARARPTGGRRPAVLGAIGRMIPEKGLVELVEELADERVRPRWRRLVAAAFAQDQGYERSLRERVGRLGLSDAVALGPRPAAEVLAEIDALVVPSTGFEAQPTVIIEALAAGVPVIVRSALWCPAYEDLPVLRYESPGELAAALTQLPEKAAPLELIAARFGPEQFVAELEAAAG